MKNLPVFGKGLKFYTELHLQIIQELESEISRTRLELQEFQLRKEAHVRQILATFDKDIFLSKKQQQLEQSVSTLRDLPAFSQNHNVQDFKWPTAIDLLKMPTDQPIQVVKLRWKTSSANSSLIGGVQVVLSNGYKSPVFLAQG